MEVINLGEAQRKNDVYELFIDIEKINNSIIDPVEAFSERNDECKQSEYSTAFAYGDENLEDFDWSGIKFATDSFELIEAPSEPWSKTIIDIRNTIDNGYFWDMPADEYGHHKDFIYKAAKIQKPIQSFKVQTFFKELDRLPVDRIDILSSKDEIYDLNDLLSKRFEMDVPLKICNENDGFILKADIPDILINQEKADKRFPSNINLKSVLALLPERINTRSFKAYFEDGEFRLEVPKKVAFSSAMRNKKHSKS